jgi:hydroxypyruvate isomerase
MEETGNTNLGFLLDQFHVVNAGGDLFADIEKYGDRIIHVQLADTPDRGEPGSGSGEIRKTVQTLLDQGYSGFFALEFIPRESTERSLEVWAAELQSWT